ncbi:TonB-dependent receptor [Spirosoma utsteinense]|uniref:Iron complex outermembrane receptor protein n=1 Tax=Spirosoma utsteinense TaxID=2585773 RepID=A0ABR6W6F9_9BACT|nr:TonB-dependent receptor [Spirosoma utsteinense]MBC3787924.1 iron complex outermembrane receptor protein [Spirosoma utsteinense]MBC3792153.1 iron complex outermembrane receptor protein [Spirosoma utsteinense]
MKHFFTIILLLSSVYLKAQTISGLVIDSQTGSPVAGATVKLLGADKGTATDSLGKFALDAPATGTLHVSFIGFRTMNVKVRDRFCTIELVPEIAELQTVEVVGRVAKDYTSEYSFSATKIAGLNKDISQSIGTVTKELMADRQAFQLADAVKIVSGVTPSSFYNQYAIRGISQNEEGQIINGMRTRQYYFLQPLTTNIERVEVLKGPASASFSSVDPGGSINLVTKKPLAVDRKEVSLSGGSFSTMRGTLDFTGPLNAAKTLLYRVNGAYQEARSYRDLVRNNALLFSPSISYIPNQKTALNAELILSRANGNLDRGQPIFGAVAGVTNLNSTPISLNLGASNDFFNSKELIITTNLAHKFTDRISVNVSYMKQTWTEDLQEHRTTNAFASDLTGKPVTSLAAMQFVQRKQFWNVDNLNAYVNFNFNTGPATHDLLVGYDLSDWHKLKGGGQNAARGFLLKDGSVAGSFVVANAANYQTLTAGGATLPRPNVNYLDLNNLSYTIRNVSDYVLNARTPLPAALTTTNAIYAQEQLRWNKIRLLLGLRYESFRDITNYNSPGETSFTKTALLPRLGLTYSLTPNLNIYGTYLEGFQGQSNTVTLLPNTGSFFNTAKSANLFEPLRSDLKEIGAKAQFFGGRISLNAAGYEINQRNLLLNANLPAFPDSLVTRGAERSRGFEMDVAGYLLPNWQINASYSYIDAVIVSDNEASLVGARKQNTPRHSGNLWTRYNFEPNSALGDLGIGFGGQHSGSKIPWFSRAFAVPAYTLFDMALYYTPAKSSVQVALNINNLTNQTYWVGAQNYLRLFPGAPRNMMLTLTYRF